MRVVGGKHGDDGRLVAAVVWIVPTGPADKAGVCQGDKVSFHLNTLHSKALACYRAMVSQRLNARQGQFPPEYVAQ